MRLIDADELKTKAFGKRGGLIHTSDIDHAPTVDPVKHGRWKPFDLTWGRSVYYCTSCGEAGEVPTEMGKPIYEFCPYCGAKMDKEDDHDDHL